jgi:competence protein ComEC
VIGLCLALTADWVESSADDVRITVLDVGQGQCILLQSEGRSFLVDCGGTYGDEAADQASEALLRQGIGKLDGLILTHLDQDHSNGVKGLLSRVETELLILPETYSELPVLTEAQLICVRETIDITFENTAITVYPATFPGNDNEKSLCVLFDTQKCDILITGDRDAYGERSLLRNETIPDVDILIAGHHGAASSTCEELLEAVKPEIVCISAGAGNFYGHPAPELLQRLEEFGCAIYRTDEMGTIIFRG